MSGIDLSDSMVKLVKYSIVSIERGRERALVCNECKVFSDDMEECDFSAWVLADYCQHHEIPSAEKKSLRVTCEVLSRWPKQSLGYESKHLRRLEEIRLAILDCGDKLPVARKAKKEIVTAVKGGRPEEKTAVEEVEAEKRAATELGEGERKALAALEALGGQAAMGELVKESGTSRGRLRRQLNVLIDAGVVRRVGKGLQTRYLLVEE